MSDADDLLQSSTEFYATKSLESSVEIYGTNDNDGHVMSERVQSLASSVYQEFEHMIKKYDEDVVKELMPLVVGILEALDISYVEKQEREVEIELLRDDNEQLLNQYEREKQLRKSSEQRILEIDDALEEEKKQTEGKIESLESLVRMLELKGKNASDHVGRLEEKESEMKKEYQKLHERYTELFKTHMDYLERTKMLMVSDSMMSATPRPKTFTNVNLRPTGIPLVPVQQMDTPLRQSAQSITNPSPAQPTPADNINVYDEIKVSEENANAPQQGMTIDEAVALEFESSGEFSAEKEADNTGECSLDDMLGHGQEAFYDSDGNDITGFEVNPGEFASSGVGKEVENLIQENAELLATKNALNIVKDDLIAKVDELSSEQEILREEIKSINTIREKSQEKITQMEEIIKKQKEEMEKNQGQKTGDDDDVPLVMRKRFTRVEMARVLMERNQYKERLMELQEAVRWTEMIRASREHPELVSGGKKKSSIWNFFSNLFSSQNKPKGPHCTLRFNVPNAQVHPIADPNRNDKSKAYDFLQDEVMAEKSKKERAKERKEQYKQVRAHVKKDDGRMQAYGWSLPTKTQAPILPKEASRSNMPVPVPVYCRPLLEKEPSTKLWCASGVNLSGGRTRDGGAMVGASIFYSGRTKQVEVEKIADEVERLNQEIREHEKGVKAVTEDRQLSSLVWIVTTTHTHSQVTVIDANNPGDSLDSFDVTSAHVLCITSVEGALETDYTTGPEDLPTPTPEQATPERSPKKGSRENSPEPMGLGRISMVEVPKKEPAVESTILKTITKSQSKGADDKEGIAALPMEDEFMYVEVERFSSVLPTMWMGSQRGDIYVHSSVSKWKQCLHTVRLGDSVLSIVHVKGRVLAALADGTVAAFHRANDGQWDLNNYHVLSLGRPQHSIRCMTAVANKNVWLGYGNRVYVVNPKNLKIEHSFDAHPRKESQVRQLAWAGDGVWISIRLDSTLRLYHAYTYDHLQDVDIEPYVSKMLGTGKLGFSFVRITSLLISSMRLWIGTGNGVIISIPLSENSKSRPIASKGTSPGGVIRVYNDTKTDAITPGSFLPYCSMAQAQLSFHGHKDAVKFFTAVPGKPPPTLSSGSANKDMNIGKPLLGSTMLVISGGEGYVDFRIGDGDGDEEGKEEKRGNSLSHGDKSHLIVWEVSMTG